VVESLLAVVSVEESVSPTGRLLPEPIVDPLPFASPWQFWQVPGLGTEAWNSVDLLQAGPEGTASLAWHLAQSRPSRHQ